MPMGWVICIQTNTKGFFHVPYLRALMVQEVCTYAQTLQSLHSLHTQSMDVDEDSDQKLDL